MVKKIQISRTTLAKPLFVIATVAAATCSFAAESFRTHFATAGTLGENIFSSDIKPGFVAGIGYKRAVADTLTDGSGNEAGVPGNLATMRVGTGTTFPANISYQNKITQEYLLGAYTSASKFSGGNLTATIVIPYTTFDKSTTVTANPNNQPFTTIAAALSKGATASSARLDDIEIGGYWDYKKSENTKYSIGLALTTKTGGYESNAPGSSVGQGFYTLKPSFTSITQDGQLSYAYKATLGVNTANNDFYGYRGGNILSLEGAVGYKTSVGAFGLKAHSLKQIQDDRVNAGTQLQYSPQPDGNRISYITLTAYYTVPVKPLESIFYLGVSSMQKSTYSAVPQSGYFEMRLSKAFN